jgi:hypothetical protein
MRKAGCSRKRRDRIAEEPSLGPASIPARFRAARLPARVTLQWCVTGSLATTAVLTQRAPADENTLPEHRSKSVRVKGFMKNVALFSGIRIVAGV